MTVVDKLRILTDQYEFLTHKVLAEMLGVARATVGTYFSRGDTEPSAAKVRRLVHGLQERYGIQIPFEWFYNEATQLPESAIVEFEKRPMTRKRRRVVNFVMDVQHPSGMWCEVPVLATTATLTENIDLLPPPLRTRLEKFAGVQLEGESRWRTSAPIQFNNPGYGAVFVNSADQPFARSTYIIVDTRAKPPRPGLTHAYRCDDGFGVFGKLEVRGDTFFFSQLVNDDALSQPGERAAPIEMHDPRDEWIGLVVGWFRLYGDHLTLHYQPSGLYVAI